MSPSSLKKLGAAFAIASAGKVAANSYTLTDEYTADNFFEKFDFYVSETDGTDPTHGFVNYRAQADAESLGLISSTDGKIYIGPDSNQTYSSKGSGRDSVRIMSKAKYNQGLMIAKFSHMPVQSCGSWPAFWSYGSPWLSSGEIDYYEGWNDLGSNVMALHTNTTIAGQCLLTTEGVSAKVTTQDCDDQKVDISINQYVGTGCGVSDTAGVWSSEVGATFAMQWADEHIKIWNWLPSKVPADITAGTPDPDANSDSWGKPQLFVEESNCDLASAFSNQQLVFNIDFCGDTAGNSVLWANTCSAMGDSCVDYVSSTPEAFAETYFEIEGIQFYELGAGSASVSASASAAISASAVIATSEAVTVATSAASGLLAGAGSVLASTLGVSATVDLTVPVAATSTHSHTTSYITGTATRVNEKGETTVVVEVDTTICPVTASEASESSVLAAASTPVPAQTTSTSETSAIATTPAAVPSTTHSHTTSYVTGTATRVNEKGETTVVVEVDTTICPVTASEASESSVLAAASTPVSVQTTATSETPAVATTPATSVPVVASTSLMSTTVIEESTSTLTQMMTSTVYATHTSTISSCAPGASGCAIGDVSTVVVPLSTTICPVTAAEASQSANASTVVASASASHPVPLAAQSSSVSRAATSKTAAAYTSVPLAAQPKPTTISRVTKSIAVSETTMLASSSSSSTSETALEMATGTPTAAAESSVTYGDATETLAVASATYSYPGGNGTTAGVAASTTGSGSAASPTSTCAGIDCIVVSSSGSKSTVGVSGIALAAIAGAMFLL